MIYEKCLESDKYPSLWKKANVLPIHKKESRQLKKNYCPISTLPFCGKLFEKLIFDEIYDHLEKNDLLTPNQSGFRPGDSTINQLSSITYCIYTAFEEFPSRETRAVFLDKSNAFDEVWDEGLSFKLECNGVSGPLLVMIHSHLSNRVQRAVLNGKISKWTSVTAGAPQGSLPGPLFFLIYINDLVDNLSSEAKLFADDTSLFSVVYDEKVTAEKFNKDLETISKGAHQWKMQFNPEKNKQATQVIFSHKSPKPPHLPLYFNQAEVPVVKEHKHFGMILDSKLDLSAHVKEAIVKARRGIGRIRYFTKYVSRDVRDQIYKLYVRPHLDYGDIIYHKHDREFINDMTKILERIQYSAALTVSGAWRGTNIDRLYEELGWEVFTTVDGIEDSAIFSSSP